MGYEDMYDDLPSAVKKIAKFLNIPVDDEIVANVVKASSISEMKQNSIGLNHIRQGGYGKWRDVLTARVNETFDDVYRYRMHGSGLTFNFGKNSRGEDCIF